jgi:nickel-dependent lactate racemase
MQIVKVPQLAWFGPREFEFPLPEDWQVKMCYMDGYNSPELRPEEIRQALREPIGTRPLSEIAKGKKEVVIVFDDLARVTRAARIVPVVLEELAAAGIPEDNIRFICGLGLHGVMYRSDLAKKLGEEVVSRFQVFNHNAFGNCAYVGTTTTFKTRVHINEEYLKCDLRILIGACVPHPLAGFGGGSKLILPGIASSETISWHHRAGGLTPDTITGSNKPVKGMGLIEDNPFKKDIDEAAELAGIDFLINSVVNLWGESIAVYCGEWKLSYAAALERAKKHYATPMVWDQDIVISNSYAKASESLISMQVAMPMLSSKGGDIVVIANAPEGQVPHYLISPFGKTTYASQYVPCQIPAHIHKVIAFTEYPHRGSSWFGQNQKITYLSQWDRVVQYLRETHGAGTRVAVIPDATNQFFLQPGISTSGTRPA